MIIPNPEEPVEVSGFNGEIEFDHVWFAYNNENWVLKDISFTIASGASVAIIGKSGSGKSTLMHAMSGLDRPQTGQISAIRSRPPPSARSRCGLFLS